MASIETSLSQPQIAVLPEASEVPDQNRSPRNSPTSTSGVPTSLLLKPSTSIGDKATTAEKPKPRPRPRPTTVINDTTDQQADKSLLTDSISNATPPLQNIASISQPDSVAQFSSATGLNYSKESDPVEPYSQDIAERAKTRTRVAAVKPPAQKSTEVEPEVIELSSDSDDELAFIPPKKSKGKEKAKPKAKPKPKPKAKEKIARPPRKKAKATHDTSSSNPTNSIPPDSVFADAPPDPQLPPSDPTLRLTPTESHTGAAPIGPLDSSPLPQPPRKRKRPQQLKDDNDDEQRQDSIYPPPFFAGSSSSVPVPSAPLEPVNPSSPTSQLEVQAVPKSKARKRKIAQSDDDADWDGDDDTKPAPKTKPKPKPRARKRKAAHDDDEVSPVPDAVPAPKRKRQAPRKKAEVVIEVPKSRSRTNTASNSPTKSNADPPAPTSPSPAKDPLFVSDKGDEDDEFSKDGSSTNSKPLQSRSRRRTGSKKPPRTNANSKKVKGKKQVIVPSDDEGDELQVNDNVVPSKGKSKAIERPTPSPHEYEQSADKEQASGSKEPPSRAGGYMNNRTPSSSAMRSPNLGSTRGYILPRRDSRPMDEILRKVAAQTGSPYLANSPLDKMRKSNFTKVVPLHRNRRTPPPPPPPPPPPKKTKKQLELEEKWEMELEESVDGWFCLTDAERSEHRRAKWNAERGYDD